MRGSEAVREDLEAQDRELMAKLRIFARRRMTECGLTQGAMARRAGLAPATLSTWLKGETVMDPDSVIKLCGALHNLRPHAATASVLREAEALAATG